MPIFMAPEIKEIPVKMTQSVEIDWGFDDYFTPEVEAILDRLCFEYNIFDKLPKKTRHLRSA